MLAVGTRSGPAAVRPALAGSLTVLSGLLGSGCVSAVCYGATAAAPPSASFPSGVAGGRVRSWIHVSLFSLTRRLRDSHICGPPISGHAIYTSRWLAWLAVGYSAEYRFSYVRLASGKLDARSACTGSAAMEDFIMVPSPAEGKQVQKEVTARFQQSAAPATAVLRRPEDGATAATNHPC